MDMMEMTLREIPGKENFQSGLLSVYSRNSNEL